MNPVLNNRSSQCSARYKKQRGDTNRISCDTKTRHSRPPKSFPHEIMEAVRDIREKPYPTG